MDQSYKEERKGKVQFQLEDYYKDYYKVLELSRRSLYYMVGCGLPINKAAIKRDKQVAVKKRSKLNMIEKKKEEAKKENNLKRYNELIYEEMLVNYAYEQLKSEELRRSYHRRLDRKKREGKEDPNHRSTPYERLLISEKELNSCKSEEEKDQLIRQRREELKDIFLFLLEQEKDIEIRPFIHKKLWDIDCAYERIQTQQHRINYERFLKKQNLEYIYSHKDEVRKESINRNKKGRFMVEEDIWPYETRMNQQKIGFYDDRNLRILTIRKVGRIVYQKYLGPILDVGAYEITRNFGGKDISDICYTNADLSLEKLRGDPNYCACVVNELFAEDTIRGAKFFNGRYLGGIQKDEQGNYTITIDKERLSEKGEEISEFTAVMIVDERKRIEEEKAKREDEYR